MGDLCELGGQIGDAKEHLHRAAAIACAMLGTDLDGHTPVWPALEELADALSRLATELDDLPGEEMGAAIEAAHQEQDEMSDRADGLSY